MLVHAVMTLFTYTCPFSNTDVQCSKEDLKGKDEIDLGSSAPPDNQHVKVRSHIATCCAQSFQIVT